MRILSFFNKNKSKVYAPAYEAYLAYFTKKINLKKPICETRFIVLDTETTGLDPKKDHILSVAAIEVRGTDFSVKNRLECYVEQPEYQPGESIAVHGILPHQSAGGISEKAMLQQLLELVKDAIIVGHHIGFDIAILNESMQREMGGPLKNKTLDTSTLARRIEDPFKMKQVRRKNYSLDNLCKKYDIEMGERHTAAGDVFITALLFLKLLGQLERKKVRTLGELLR
ncbi:MAG: 3'-5' exonuclease [Bacteroidota bacterium]